MGKLIQNAVHYDLVLEYSTRDVLETYFTYLEDFNYRGPEKKEKFLMQYLVRTFFHILEFKLYKSQPHFSS